MGASLIPFQTNDHAVEFDSASGVVYRTRRPYSTVRVGIKLRYHSTIHHPGDNGGSVTVPKIAPHANLHHPVIILD
jgi:hypothetical protein